MNTNRVAISKRREPQGSFQSSYDRVPLRAMAGISLGGLLVVIGVVVAVFWSLWLGVIVALIGLIAFGGFARGRWY